MSRSFNRGTLLASLTLALLSIASLAAAGPARSPSPGTWPQRVLITNDNGIQDAKIWALGKAFAEHSDTWIVAPDRNRSGASNYLSLSKDKPTLTVKRRQANPHLNVYSADGFPADCVGFGVLGLLKNNPPDLIVSGINGGPNLGMRSWASSGTIGAARTAALMGIPAIAVSGLHGKDKAMVAKVADWIVELAQSDLVRNLKPGQYLTVAIPRVHADKILGIRIAPHMPMTAHTITFDRISPTAENSDTQIWAAKPSGDHDKAFRGSDVALYREGFIVITPMQVGEDDNTQISLLEQQVSKLPPWPSKH